MLAMSDPVFLVSNYSGVWPIIVLIALVVLPSVLITIFWGGAWAVLRSRFVSWQFAIGAVSISLLLVVAGVLVLYLWPVTPDPDAALFGEDAGIKIFGGLALVLGGIGGLVPALATWGICELARRVRATTRGSSTRDLSQPPNHLSETV
jgi:hypothetical protein